LHGRDDGAFGVEGVAGTEGCLPAGSEVVVIDGAGHFLHLDQPTVVNPRILEWVALD
jgi:pimeloyl-ACP methyl ester carboxylesterase